MSTISERELRLRDDLRAWHGVVRDLLTRLDAEHAAFAGAGRPWPAMLGSLGKMLHERPVEALIRVRIRGSWLPPSGGRGQWCVCLECLGLDWLRESELRVRRAESYTCSQECDNRRHLPSDVHNPLQRRLLAHLRARALSLSNAMQATGITSLRWWHRAPTHHLESNNLRALAAFLKIPYEEALEEAGGVTGEDVQLTVSMTNLPKAAATNRTRRYARALRAAGKGRRGRPHSPEHVANLRAGVTRRGPPTNASGLRDFARSPLGAVLRPLVRRLREQPKPSRADIHAWAKDIARRVPSHTATGILETWVPWLQRRGLWSAAGRKSDEKRYEVVMTMMADWPRTRTGKLGAGFWPKAGERVGRSGPELYEWYRQRVKAQVLDGVSPR